IGSVTVLFAAPLLFTTLTMLRLRTLRLTAFDSPPPGVGLKTVMVGVPAATTSAALICAVSWVLLTKVVGRSTPFHLTTDALMKSLPFTVNANAASPAVLFAGEIAEITGNGVLTVKLTDLEL